MNIKRIAYIIHNGMTALDFIVIFNPLSKLKTMDFIPDLDYVIYPMIMISIIC